MDNNKVSFKQFVDLYEKKVECPKCKGKGCEHCDNKGYHIVNEALSMTQRRRKSVQFRRMKGKIKIGQQRAKMRVATMDRLKKRARKAARNFLVKRITKGVPKGELDFARREAIEKRVDRMKSKIDQIARKMLPQLRRAEMERRNKKSQDDDK